jgi:hypothetical protein
MPVTTQLHSSQQPHIYKIKECLSGSLPQKLISSRWFYILGNQGEVCEIPDSKLPNQSECKLWINATMGFRCQNNQHLGGRVWYVSLVTWTKPEKERDVSEDKAPMAHIYRSPSFSHLVNGQSKYYDYRHDCTALPVCCLLGFEYQPLARELDYKMKISHTA